MRLRTKRVRCWVKTALVLGLAFASAAPVAAQRMNRQPGGQSAPYPPLVIPVEEIPALDDLARRYLRLIQQKSIKQRVEYCAYIYRLGPGRFMADKPVSGEWDACTLYENDSDNEIVASFHTHAAYDRIADSEVPSVLDLEGDMEDGLVGYVSTPAGRFWRTNYPMGKAVQICGTGCLPVDPDLGDESEFGKVPQSITIDQLRRRQGQ